MDTIFLLTVPAVIAYLIHVTKTPKHVAPYLTVIVAALAAMAVKFGFSFSDAQTAAIFFAGTSSGTAQGLYNKAPEASTQIGRLVKKPKVNPQDPAEETVFVRPPIHDDPSATSITKSEDHKS